MAIIVKGYLTFRKIVGERSFPLSEGESMTVDDLLARLSNEIGEQFNELVFDPQTGALSQHVSVLVNGRHCSHLPDKLDTQLKDGDEVAIFPPLAGG
jgi:MoaD family protein